MAFKEGLTHIASVVLERVVEGYVRHGRGRAEFVAELIGKVRSGGDILPEDEKRISLMPPSWRETARISMYSSRLLRDTDHLVQNI